MTKNPTSAAGGTANPSPRGPRGNAGPAGPMGPVGPMGPPGTPADPAVLTALQNQVKANQRWTRKQLRRSEGRQREFRNRVAAVLCVMLILGTTMGVWLLASNARSGQEIGRVANEVADLETRFEQFTLDFGPRVGALEAQISGTETDIADLRTWLSDELGYIRGDIERFYSELDGRLQMVEGQSQTPDELREMVLATLADCGIPCRTCGEAPPPPPCPTCTTTTVVVTTTTVVPPTTTTTEEPCHHHCGTTTTTTAPPTTTTTTSTTVPPTTTTTEPCHHNCWPTTTTTTTTTVPPTTTTTTVPIVGPPPCVECGTTTTAPIIGPPPCVECGGGGSDGWSDLPIVDGDC
jgi:hypothetical protein